MLSIHVNDSTTVQMVIVDELDQPVDISDATTLEFLLESPDESVKVATGTLVTDGKDGAMQFVAICDNKFDTAGTWKIQGHCVCGTGTFHTDIVEVPIKFNLAVSS